LPESPSETITEADFERKFGEITQDALIRAQFIAFLTQLGDSEPSRDRTATEIWNGTNSPGVADLIALVVSGHFQDLSAGRLSWDVTYCKYQWVIPKRGPKLKKCDCEACLEKEDELKTRKLPENSADGEMYKREQEVAGHEKFGKEIPIYTDHVAAAVKAREKAMSLIQALKAKYDGPEDSRIEDSDRQKWSLAIADCDVYDKLLAKTIADVTEAVKLIERWYDAYEEALAKKSREFEFTLGGRKITWEVTLQSEIERSYPY